MSATSILFDAHVHIYPDYNIDTAISASLNHMDRIIGKNKLTTDTVKMWLLTEGTIYNGFNQLLALDSDKYTIEKSGPASLVIRDKQTQNNLLYVLAGRQIVSSDKLEICALATDFNMADRELNTQDTINKVQDNDAVAALNWAPGKWFTKRGKIVSKIIETNNPEKLLISETTMRPTIWPTPALVKQAFRKNFRMVVGSDPLPFSGEESLVGSYVSLVQGEFDSQNPEGSIKTLLLDPTKTITRLGKRSGTLTFAKRQYKIMSYNK